MDMNDLIHSHENYMKLVGKWGKYQKILSIVVVLSILCLSLVILTIPMNEAIPNFKYQNGTDIQVVDRQIFCNEIYYTKNYDKVFDHIIITSSMKTWASDLKIVCNTKRIFSIVGTIHFIASIASYLSLSKFPDRYGRNKVYLFLNIVSLVSIFQLLFLNNFAQILITGFVLGLGSINLAIGSVIVNENIDGNYTALIMGIGMSMFPLGGIVNINFMYFFNDWRYYAFLILILMSIDVYLSFKYIKESPKWLLANHRITEYFEVLLHIATINGTYENTLKYILEKQPKFKRRFSVDSNPPNEIMEFKEEYRKIIYEITDLVKHRSVRMLTILNLYLWMISGFSFFGILLNLSNLTGNIYIDSIVSYTAEFLAEIGSGYIADRFGRKPTLFWSFTFATVGCALFPFAFTYYIQIPLLFISCIGIASAFNVLYIYSAELFPTNIKSLAVGIFFVFNRIAAGSVPLILTMMRNVIVIIFFLSCGAAIIVMFLPETLNKEPIDEVVEVQYEIYENETNSIAAADCVSFNELYNESF